MHATGGSEESELPEGLRAGWPMIWGGHDWTEPDLLSESAMTESSHQLESLDALRTYVHQTLCRKENLVEEQFAMRETPLVICGAACGLQFTIKGPRSIRLSAVWAADPNMIYFYDATGERFLKVRIENRFEWAMASAA